MNDLSTMIKHIATITTSLKDILNWLDKHAADLKTIRNVMGMTDKTMMHGEVMDKDIAELEDQIELLKTNRNKIERFIAKNTKGT